MKLLILLLSINSLFASTVPTNWFEESSTKNKGSELKVIDTMELIVDSQKEILEKTEADHLFGGWKLSGQKTDVSVSKSGILGFSAVKAASGIELNWTKKSSTKKLDEPKATQIDSSISNEQLLKEVQPSINLALDKVKLNKREKVRSNLEERILLIHQQVKDLENVQSNSWVPNKFRLSTSVSQSGNLLWWSELSGDARVRIEWSIKPKNNTKSDSKNKLVEKLVKDIEKSSASLVADNGFTLDKISMGLGLSKKNLFSLVRTKGEVVGQLFFAPVKGSVKKESLVKSEDLEGYYLMEDGESLFGKFFTRKKLRKGLEKSFKIGKVFSKSLKKDNGKWWINKMKVSFQLSYSGFLGLAGTSSAGVYEIYYKR